MLTTLHLKMLRRIWIGSLFHQDIQKGSRQAYGSKTPKSSKEGYCKIAYFQDRRGKDMLPSAADIWVKSQCRGGRLMISFLFGLGRGI